MSDPSESQARVPPASREHVPPSCDSTMLLCTNFRLGGRAAHPPTTLCQRFTPLCLPYTSHPPPVLSFLLLALQHFLRYWLDAPACASCLPCGQAAHPPDITPPTALCQRFTRLCIPLSPTPLFIPLLSFEAGQRNSLHQTTGGMIVRRRQTPVLPQTRSKSARIWWWEARGWRSHRSSPSQLLRRPKSSGPISCSSS